MSKTSRRSSLPRSKCFALGAASVLAAAGIFALAQTQQALSSDSKPEHMAARLLLPATQLLPDSNEYWHTEGNQILDRHDQPVRIAGVNWSGFETKQAVPGGLDAQDYRVLLRTIKANGFNTVRIPFSNEMVEMPRVPDHIRYRNAAGSINSDLHDLTSMEILDRIVAQAGKIGLKVILDNHRSEAGSSAEESGLWYTPEFPESAWIEDWTALARRYEHNSTVIGMDLRNEPHNADKGGACWDCGGSHDWRQAATRAGNAVLAVNSRLLIFVEGVDTYGTDSSWWGGNLEGVRNSPVHLSVPGRLVYSTHDYGPTEYGQAWFNASTSSASLAALWQRRWAYISEEGIAPVWLGEFGTPNTDADVRNFQPGSEGQWFSALIEMLRLHPNVSWTYWGINGEDRYGLLTASYSGEAANATKLEAILSLNHQAAGRARSFDQALRNESTSQTVATTAAYMPPWTHHSTIRSTSSDRSAYQMPRSGSADEVLVNPVPARRRSGDREIESAISASIHEAVRNANRNVGGESR